MIQIIVRMKVTDALELAIEQELSLMLQSEVWILDSSLLSISEYYLDRNLTNIELFPFSFRY